ncbi:MAG: DsbA family protein [Nannocystales bacterium]
MSLKSTLQPFVAAAITTPLRRDALRRVRERWRRVRGKPHRLTAFIRLDDPYALLLLHALQTVRERFDVQLELRVVGATPSSMDPAPEALRAWARLDAARVAALYDLQVPDFDARRASESESASLASLESAPDPLLALRSALEGWWRGAPIPGSANAKRLAENNRERSSRGHYLSAMVHYEGEWYWGIDRLNHLTQRLDTLGLRTVEARPAFERRFAFLTEPAPETGPSAELELFWSGRSPYAYLALERAYQLADHHSVPLRIRPVLPMVMRDLTVPLPKRRYILGDAKREADWLGIPLGFICDPVGLGIERGYALLDVARQHDRLREYVLAFSTAVWSEGIDAATEAGLEQIATNAGLPWAPCRAAMRGDHWRAEVEANRSTLLDAGQWGVPVLRCGESVVWGQDRFWVLDRALQELAASPTPPAPEHA